MKLLENSKLKIVKSEDYNYIFDKTNGVFVRWGKTKEDDPVMAPSPEILDCEITTICGMGCPYCYKSNTLTGKNMSLETFKKIVNNLNKNKLLTQVAFGLGATAEENPELWDMCRWLRSEGIVPNGTVANISEETASKIASLFGACAVSIHHDKNICYNSIKKLTDKGMNQVNVHHVIYDENYEETLQVLEDIKNDPRLQKLNAIVLLSLKKKGRATKGEFNTLSQEKFNNIVNKAMELKISFGFDSCSAHKFMEAIKGKENEKELMTMVEPCESFGLFSSYVNVEGKYFPCSFAEELFDGIDITGDDFDFDKNVWHCDKVNALRKESLSKNRKCIYYEI